MLPRNLGVFPNFYGLSKSFCRDIFDESTSFKTVIDYTNMEKNGKIMIMFH